VISGHDHDEIEIGYRGKKMFAWIRVTKLYLLSVLFSKILQKQWLRFDTPYVIWLKCKDSIAFLSKRRKKQKRKKRNFVTINTNQNNSETETKLTEIEFNTEPKYWNRFICTSVRFYFIFLTCLWYVANNKWANYDA